MFSELKERYEKDGALQYRLKRRPLVREFDSLLALQFPEFLKFRAMKSKAPVIEEQHREESSSVSSTTSKQSLIGMIKGFKVI